MFCVDIPPTTKTCHVATVHRCRSCVEQLAARPHHYIDVTARELQFSRSLDCDVVIFFLLS